MNDATGGGQAGLPQQQDPDASPFTAPLASDADLAQALAADTGGVYCWAGGLGWHRYREGRGTWEPVPEEMIAEVTRRWLLDHVSFLLEKSAKRASEGKAKDSDYYRGLAGEWHKRASAARIFAVVRLARGVMYADPAGFDAHPDHMNAPNGVIDLRTGQLLPHDPRWYFTQVTRARYVPGAAHQDVTMALQAIPDETRAYAQLRYGQAITGYKAPDDAIIFQLGSGENGKTTVVQMARKVLGGYAAVLPMRVLLADPQAHTTDLMTLRTRVGFIEELPEEHHLSVNRIKVASSPEITARLIRRDNVTFANVCQLVVSANYRPLVRETDHGTWRRLLPLAFPYRFRKPHEPIEGAADRRGDPGLRDRILADRDGKRGEAFLAWLVAGAMAWYAGATGREPMTMGALPQRVTRDAEEWRASCDLMHAYIADRLVFDRGSHVMASDLLADVNGFLAGRGHREWSEELLSSRFGGHSECQAKGVAKDRVRRTASGLSRPPGYQADAPPLRYRAWTGVRFRSTADDMAEMAAEGHGEGANSSDGGPDISDTSDETAGQGGPGQVGQPTSFPVTRRDISAGTEGVVPPVPQDHYQSISGQIAAANGGQIPAPDGQMAYDWARLWEMADKRQMGGSEHLPGQG